MQYITTVKRPKQNDSDLAVIIPAAGLSSRMKSASTVKTLLPITKDRKKILENIIEKVNSTLNGHEIIIVAGHYGEKIYQFVQSKQYNNVRICYNSDYENSNVAFSLYHALFNTFKRETLIVFSDLIFSSETLKFLYEIDRTKNYVLCDQFEKMSQDEVSLNVVHDKVTHFGFGNQKKWSQITYLSDSGTQILKKLLNHQPNQSFLFEVFNSAVSAFDFEVVYNQDNIYYEVDSFAEYSLAREELIGKSL